MNETGPGDYEVSTVWGESLDHGNSNIKSAPLYSMRQRCKTPVISKAHVQELLGLSSPGVGVYTITEKSEAPKWSVTKDKRFYVANKATKDASHTYYHPQKYMRGTVFSSDTRWKY